MEIGTHVNIFMNRYGRKSLLEEGTYLGIEYAWVKFPHDTLLKKVKQFRVGGGIIYSSDCTWEKL